MCASPSATREAPRAPAFKFQHTQYHFTSSAPSQNGLLMNSPPLLILQRSDEELPEGARWPNRHDPARKSCTEILRQWEKVSGRETAASFLVWVDQGFLKLWWSTDDLWKWFLDRKCTSRLRLHSAGGPKEADGRSSEWWEYTSKTIEHLGVRVEEWEA